MLKKSPLVSAETSARAISSNIIIFAFEFLLVSTSVTDGVVVKGSRKERNRHGPIAQEGSALGTMISLSSLPMGTSLM